MTLTTRMCIFAATVCNLSVGTAGVQGAPPPARVAVLTSASPGVAAESVETLASALRREGLEVVACDVEELGSADADAVILPDATHLPAEIPGALVRHARAGKLLVFLGAEPLSKPGRWTNGTWAAQPFGVRADSELGDLLELHCDARTVHLERVRNVVATDGSTLPSPVEFTPVFCVPRDGRSAMVPLLRTDTPAGQLTDVAAALMVHYAGPFAGSRWLLSGIATDAVARDPAVGAWHARTIASLLAGAEPNAGPRADLAVALGVTTAYSGYAFTDRDDLAEGAQRINELGSKSIKVWFTKLGEAYPRTEWPKVANLTDVARTPAFTKLFAGDFDTYVLVTFSVGMDHAYWRTKPSRTLLEEDERQFYDLARHLLTTYRGSNKTFVLQNWEGDWAIRGNYDAKSDVEPEAFRQMVEWLNARQRGVDRARAKVGETGVRVLCAAEVNQVRSSLKGERANVIDQVIPHTNVDLVSYSCYDAARDPRVLRASLEHVAAKLKPKAGMPACRVYVGEYGVGENSAGLARVQEMIPNTVDVSLGFGCPYVLYWQLYCNEAKRKPVVGNDDTKGMWLIKPDGTKAWAWHYLRNRIAGVPGGGGAGNGAGADTTTMLPASAARAIAASLNH